MLTKVDPTQTLETMALHVDVRDHRYHPLQQTLEPCSLSLNRGEVVSLIGPSGCGKSTFLRIAAGLLEPTDGRVDVKTSQSAVLFQEHRLLPWKTLQNNIALGLKPDPKLTSRDRISRSKASAFAMGFAEDDLGKYPSALSGGMKQRGALARALAVRPELLFLDEPFSALDIGRRRELYRFVLKEVELRDMALLIVTHDVTEALALSDKVLVMAPSPGRFIREYVPSIPRAQRTRHTLMELEADLLSDVEVGDLFNMRNWEQLI